MQPQLCSRCKKNIAVVFITRQENGQNVNEGLCLKCAKNLGLPQVDEMMRRMGITDEDLDNISNEMMGAFGGAENLEGLTDADDPDADNEDEDVEDYLVKKSYSATYGARNLRRTIQKELEDVMAAQIIDSYEHPVTQIHASMEDGKLVVRSL